MRRQIESHFLRHHGSNVSIKDSLPNFNKLIYILLAYYDDLFAFLSSHK